MTLALRRQMSMSRGCLQNLLTMKKQLYTLKTIDTLTYDINGDVLFVIYYEGAGYTINAVAKEHLIRTAIKAVMHFISNADAHITDVLSYDLSDTELLVKIFTNMPFEMAEELNIMSLHPQYFN